ncbi:PREDICTED: protein TPX2 isoform X4 [Theobroma cacao]|uniref:Protein TPX2 isoform X4 n=1 Tax=Theobroma cacao TaxID=3641 RepID=A0AB32W357_THECC|nr:PREDICTED: protein TPX2 isoform X4 [Theobroma cacao]
MDDQIGEQMEEFFSIEEPSEAEEFFDIKYEFDAPQCYDFSRPERYWEAKEAELWFESAGSYPPSPFVIKLKWRYDVDGDEEFSNGSVDYDDREVCNCFNEDNLRAKTESRVKSSLSRNSTLMKPTASYLAKQNQSRAVHFTQLHRRFRKFLDRLDDKSTKSSSVTEGDATKRQKLGAGYLCKVANLSHQALFVHKKPKTVRSLDGNSVRAKPNVTIPRELELQTARRAQRRRSKIKTESDENAKSHAHFFKALPLNRKILEAPSLPLPKKSLPQRPEFQLFHLRTSERARQHASNSAMKLPNYISTSRNEKTGLRSFNSVNALKEEKFEAVNKFKACPLNKKIMSSIGQTGVLQKETTAPMEFKILANRRLPDEPPIELLNKLSLSSEVHSGEKSRAKMVFSEGFKENETVPFLLQCQIINVGKENLQRIGGMEYQCRNDRTIEIGRQLNVNRSLRLDIT